jgi:hypothetical protein
MGLDLARASHEVGTHSLGVPHKFLERLVSPFQTLPDLLKARGRSSLDLAARLAEPRPIRSSAIGFPYAAIFGAPVASMASVSF